MQLKVPPKKALNMLASAIKNGDEFLEKESIEFLGLSNSRQIDYENGGTISDESIKKFERFDHQLLEKMIDWLTSSKKILDEVFDSFIYGRSFEKRIPEKDLFNTKTAHRIELSSYISSYEKISFDIPDKLEYLQSLYFKIEENIKSPLFYIKDRSTLCYYEFVCELKAESNEALLCEYMFQFSIGSKKELAEIYKFMIGEEFLKGDEKIVKNAMEGVNKKTQKFFGFSIFCKEKSVVYVQVKH